MLVEGALEAGRDHGEDSEGLEARRRRLRSVSRVEVRTGDQERRAAVLRSIEEGVRVDGLVFRRSLYEYRSDPRMPEEARPAPARNRGELRQRSSFPEV